MSAIIEGLRFSWKKNLDYGQRLVADLSEEQMITQPVQGDLPAANHPAWVLSHLNVYLPVISSLIQGKPFEDPKSHPFGMLSKPVMDSTVYESKDSLVEQFVSGHQKIDELLGSAGPGLFDQKVQLERWQNIMPTVAHALPYLMLVHENTHFGQVSAWRRVLGLPSV